MNSISEFKGKSFKQACELCTSNKLQLMLSNDDTMHELGKLTFEHGGVAGACYVATVLYVEEHGPEAAISEGVDLMKKAAAKIKREDIIHQIRESEYWIAWGVRSKSTVHIQMKKQPLKVPKKVWSSHAGFMIFLLAEGLKKLETGSTTKMLAAKGVAELLDFMVKRRSEKDAKT